jgi:hypothetical protein
MDLRPVSKRQWILKQPYPNIYGDMSQFRSGFFQKWEFFGIFFKKIVAFSNRP